MFCFHCATFTIDLFGIPDICSPKAITQPLGLDWKFHFFHFCIKQLLSNFEPQNCEKNKQHLGLRLESSCLYKKSVYNNLLFSCGIITLLFEGGGLFFGF